MPFFAGAAPAPQFVLQGQQQQHSFAGGNQMVYKRKKKNKIVQQQISDGQAHPNIHYPQQNLMAQSHFQNQYVGPQHILQQQQTGQHSLQQQQQQAGQNQQNMALGAAMTSAATAAMGSQAQGDATVTEGKAKKGAPCWKCAVDTHALKDCKEKHYCYICDDDAHPTLRCPVLKTPKPSAFVSRLGTDDCYFAQLPDSVVKDHLAPARSPIARIQVSGTMVPAVVIESQIARYTWSTLSGSGKPFRMVMMLILSAPPPLRILTGWTVFNFRYRR